MTNNYVNKLSYISLAVQNKVLNGGGIISSNWLKRRKFFAWNKMDRLSLPIFCYVWKEEEVYAKKTNNISGC